MNSVTGFLQKYRIALIVIASILVLYTLLGFLLVPWLVERQLAGTLQQRLEVETRFEDISFNPFTLAARIENAQLQTPDGDPLLSTNHLYLNFDFLPLLLLDVRLGEISIDAPELYFHRYSDSENTFSRLAERWQKTAPPDPEDTTDEGLFPVQIRNLNLSNGRLHYSDEVPETEFSTVVGPVDLQVDTFSTLADPEEGSLALQIVLEQDSRLLVDGNFTVQPLQASGQVQLENFSGTVPYRYFEAYLPFVLDQGRINVAAQYSVFSNEVSEQLDLNITNIQARVDEIIAREPDQDTPFLAGGTLLLNNGRFHLPENTLAADRLSLDGTTFLVVRNQQGALNWQQLLDALPAQEAEDPSKEAMQLAIGEIQISDVTVIVEDQVPETPARFELMMAASGQGFSRAPEQMMPFTAEMSMAAGGELTMQGELQISPELDLQAQLTLNALPLMPAQPYLNEYARVDIVSGTVESNASLRSNQSQPLSLQGDFQLNSLLLNDRVMEQDLLSVETLSIAEVDLSLADQRLTVSEVLVDQLFSRILINENGETNISLVLVKVDLEDIPEMVAEDEETPDDRDDQGTQFGIAAGLIQISNARSDFTDHNLPIPFHALIHSLDGDIGGFSTTSAQLMRIELEGQVDEFGLAEVTAALAPLNAGEQTTVEVAFTNLNLSDVNPYAMKFAGREIGQGTLDMVLEYEITEGNLDASNDLIIRNLELGERVESPDAIDLPLDLAIALLESPEGVIDIEIPVSGDINDPEFELAPVIRGAIVNVLGNIASAPFRFLGSLIGIGDDDEEFGRVEFRPGRSDISPPEQEKLLQLIEALKQRPQVALQVPAPLAEQADRHALQSNAVDERIEQMLTLEGPNERMMILESLYREAGLSPDLPQIRSEFVSVREPDSDAVQSDAAPDAQQQASGAEAPTGLQTLLAFDNLAYTQELRERLIEAEQLPENALQNLARERQPAIIDFVLNNSEISRERLQRGEIASAEVEDGWLSVELGVAQLND